MSTYAHQGYVPYDYRRVCDICGQPKNRSQLHRQSEYWVCDEHPGERTRDELSRGNARNRPFLVRPVRNAKPNDPVSPQTFEADEAAVLNFVASAVANQARYIDVTSGNGAPVSDTTTANMMGWVARYCYRIISDARRPARMIAQAKTALRSAANYVQANQVGFGIQGTDTKSTNPMYGCVFYDQLQFPVVEDTIVGGLASIYAYLVFGSTSDLIAARAAASWLRNVQAIGSHLQTNFTSSDPAGTARLYTGGLVQTVAGDIVELDGSDNLFYPSSLMALELWKQLLVTDGDQMIGADSGLGFFFGAPQQLLSKSIADLRAFWLNGTFDVATGKVITGLSSSTPRELFRAYPQSNQFFPSAGTGSWEFSNGNATLGTQITSQNFAKALAALYAYEGASTQVTAVDDYLYAFTSNPGTETAAGTTAQQLARALTGTYDPTITFATTMSVAGASANMNGSSMYDWGAFGLISALRQARHQSTFTTARLYALPRRQRYVDGLRSDGDAYDVISLRGRSGLSFQTGFKEALGQRVFMAEDAIAAAQFGDCFRYQPYSLPRSV